MAHHKLQQKLNRSHFTGNTIGNNILKVTENRSIGRMLILREFESLLKFENPPYLIYAATVPMEYRRRSRLSNSKNGNMLSKMDWATN